MCEFVNYEKKYEKQLIDLWIDVCVEEFGFEEWREGMGVVEEELYDKMLLAVVDGKVIGSMGYMDIGDNTAEIKRVYTYPEFRGNGISQKMLDLILEDAKDRGFAKVVIETWSKFNRGINFYVKNNFSLKEQEGDCYRYERSL